MNDQPTVIAIVCFLVLVFIAFIFLWLRDRATYLIWKFRNPPAVVTAMQEAYANRLAAPDWQFYEQHLQRPVPETLRDCYSSPGILYGEHFFGDFHIAFSPIDSMALHEKWETPGIVAYAVSDGDPIFMKPGSMEPNKVYIEYQDGGDVEELAPSIEAFVAGLQPAKRNC